MNTKISDGLRSKYSTLELRFDSVDNKLHDLWAVIGGELVLSKNSILKPDGMARKLARGHLFRCFDLANGAVACINSGSVQAAFALVRGLYESFAAMHHVKSAFERTRTMGGMDELMGEIIPRIAFGNRCMKGQGHATFLESVNVMTTIKKADKFLSLLMSELTGESVDSKFLTNYEFLSEFVHPAQGSITSYESSVSNALHYTYEPRMRDIDFVCGQLNMLTEGLLVMHEALSGFSWKNGKREGRR